MTDIFKKAFLEGFASADITIVSVIMALATSLAISIYVFIVYRALTRKTFYSKNFNISLVGVALITAAIIVTIQSSIVVSLGMVGALSIVRFRTAIKDPIDLMFLFWAISIGIICGAGLAEYAILLSIILTVAIVILEYFPVAKAPCILIVNSNNVDCEEIIIKKIEKTVKHYSIKSRNIASDSINLTVELRTDSGGELIRSIYAVEGVTSVSLLKHDGEVTF